MEPKYPRTFHLPFSPEIHSDDKTHKNPEFFVGKEVVITEKLDGGNTLLADGNVYARSTGQPATHGSFSYIKRKHAHKTLGDSLKYYGENLMGIHSIIYDPLPDYFFLFAILDGETWCSWDELVENAFIMEFLIVPIRYRGVFKSLKEIQKWMDTEVQKPSLLGGDCEGFVIRTVDGFTDFSTHVAKYVRSGHVQTDERWDRNWVQAELQSARVQPL